MVIVTVIVILIVLREKSKQPRSSQDFFTHWTLDATLIDWMAEVGENIVGDNGSDDCVRW